MMFLFIWLLYISEENSDKKFEITWKTKTCFGIVFSVESLKRTLGLSNTNCHQPSSLTN